MAFSFGEIVCGLIISWEGILKEAFGWGCSQDQWQLERVTQFSTMANSKQQGKEKEMTASVTNVYLHVVEDVINNVRADFQSEGVDDNVLNELQAVR